MEKREIAIAGLASFVLIGGVLIVRKIITNRSKGSPKWPKGTRLLFNDKEMSVIATNWHGTKRIDDVAYFDQWWYTIEDKEYPEELMDSLVENGYIVFS